MYLWNKKSVFKAEFFQYQVYAWIFKKSFVFKLKNLNKLVLTSLLKPNAWYVFQHHSNFITKLECHKIGFNSDNIWS